MATDNELRAAQLKAKLVVRRTQRLVRSAALEARCIEYEVLRTTNLIISRARYTP